MDGEQTFEQCKARWLTHAQCLMDVSLEIIAQCDRLDTVKGMKDPRVVALTLLSRSLGHLRAIPRLLDLGLITEARTLTRCLFENLFMLGGLAESGDEFVRQLVEDAAKSKQSRGNWVLSWFAGRDEKSPHEDGLRKTVEDLRGQYPKARAINFADVTKGSSISYAYLWYKQLSSDAAHPSLEALTRHVAKQRDGSILLTVEAKITENDILDTIQWSCQALIGVIVATNQVAGPVKAGEKLEEIFSEFLRMSGGEDGAAAASN